MTKKIPSAHPVPRPPSVPAHSHAVRDASAVSGAVAGIAIGAVAGPGGAVAGGIIGTAIGAFAGQALEENETKETEKEERLDRIIGVSEGDMGAVLPDEKSERPPS